MAEKQHKPEKTNAVRHLESCGLTMRMHPFRIGDGEHLDAVQVAELVGFDPYRVFKTLVCSDETGRHLVFCIPGPFELDTRKAAAAAGSKRVELIRVADLTPVTGYIRGGCSPIGMKKKFPTFVDETASLHDTVLVSAGVRGLQVELSPVDLLTAAEACYAGLC